MGEAPGNYGALLEGICHLLLASGYLLFVDSMGFGLGSPDRCAEDAGKLTILFDEVLDQGGAAIRASGIMSSQMPAFTKASAGKPEFQRRPVR